MFNSYSIVIIIIVNILFCVGCVNVFSAHRLRILYRMVLFLFWPNLECNAWILVIATVWCDGESSSLFVLSPGIFLIGCREWGMMELWWCCADTDDDHDYWRVGGGWVKSGGKERKERKDRKIRMTKLNESYQRDADSIFAGERERERERWWGPTTTIIIIMIAW